jgi:hypothetical protein
MTRQLNAIAQAGNIGLDMLQMLVAYDLAIADISIDNANAFYELGIHHALRPTILIRSIFPATMFISILKPTRLRPTKPAASVDLLAKSISETISAMQSSERKPDSPVFFLLSELEPPDRVKLIVGPT